MLPLSPNWRFTSKSHEITSEAIQSQNKVQWDAAVTVSFNVSVPRHNSQNIHSGEWEMHVGQLSTWPNWQHSCSLSYKLTHSPRPFNSFSNSPLFLHTDFWRKDVTTIKVRGCCFPGNSTRSTQSPLELACYVPRYYHPSLRGNKLWQQLNILWNEYVHNSRMNQ